VEIDELEGLVASVTLTECTFTIPEVIVSISDLETEIIRVCNRLIFSLLLFLLN
jgi:hypothetical protein